METGWYIRFSEKTAGETRHRFGFESHPPHCESKVKKRSHLRLWRFQALSRHQASRAQALAGNHLGTRVGRLGPIAATGTSEAAFSAAWREEAAQLDA